MLYEGNANCNTGQPAKPDSSLIATNNNSNYEPIRFIPTSNFGTYDTVRLTSVGVSDADIRDPYDWQLSAGLTLGAVSDGLIPSVQKRLFIDSNGNEVEKGQHTATIGIDFKVGQARLDKHRLGDIMVVTIPSAPAMMYGDPTQPLLPQHIPQWIERVQTIVDKYVQCDVGQFNVSRVDSSTVYSVAEPVAAYIGLFNAITGAKQRRTNKKLYEDETVQFFNKSQAVGFYDKSAKEDHFALPVDLEDDRNLLRFEVQRKKKQAVQSTYGKLVFMDLQAEATIAQAVRMRGQAFDQFFPFNGEMAKDFTNHYNLFRLMRDQSKRNHIANFTKALAIREGLITVEQLDLFMRLEGYSPQYISRHNKALREMESMWMDTKDLYNEVRQLIQTDLKAVA